MAKKATAKADSSGGKKVAKRSKSSSSAGARSQSRGSRSGSQSQGESVQSDMVDALIKLLQSPLVIDLLAVGATAALAAITEQRSSRAQGAVGGNSKKMLKVAGKGAAAAVGRRNATEFDEIKAASKKAGEGRATGAGARA